MIKNKYFILNYPISEGDLRQFVEFKSLKPRINNDGTKCIVKLPVAVEPKLELKKQTSYTHSEIRTELAKKEWQPKDI